MLSKRVKERGEERKTKRQDFLLQISTKAQKWRKAWAKKEKVARAWHEKRSDTVSHLSLGTRPLLSSFFSSIDYNGESKGRERGGMSKETVADVGLDTSSSVLKVLTPKSAFERVKEIVQSQQFQDGIKIFAIGAAVSASKSIADSIWSALKRLFVAQATFRGRDEAYRWMLLFMTTHPNFRKSPRAVEVSARPSLLIDSQVDARGLMSGGEIKSLWNSLEGKDTDDDDKTTSQVEKKRRIELEQERQEKKDSLGVHFFPAPGEQLHFVYQGTHFWASRERQLVGDTEWDETITLSFVSLTSTPLRRLIKQARQMYQDHTRGRISIYRTDRYGNWISSSGVSKRPADSVHLPGTMKEELLEDATRFISTETRRWYNDRGIPYRRGYLFHGPPGTGKSSLCHVLASVLEEPIYVLNLSSSSMGDAEFLERMSEIPSGSIVLIEDVDVAFAKRNESNLGGGLMEEDKKANLSISFSALLNAIDGVGAAEGRILCITTNYIDRLDKALIRPGRIDKRFQFNCATPSQAKELFLRWYMPKNGSFEKVEAQANVFAQSIPNNLVSVAALQGFLLGCGDDYNKAVREVGRWIQEQEQE